MLSLVRHNQPITVNELLIHPGEIVAADRDGVVKIPAGDDPAKVLEKGREIQEREARYHAIFSDPDLTWQGIKEYQQKDGFAMTGRPMRVATGAICHETSTFPRCR